MSTGDSKKRTAEEVSNADARAARETQGEVPLKRKRDLFWSYLDFQKKLEELELEVREIKKKMKVAETRYPELLQAKGCADRVFRTTIVEVTDFDDKNKWVHAETLLEGKEVLEDRRKHKVKELQKKEEQKAKKQKKDGST